MINKIRILLISYYILSIIVLLPSNAFADGGVFYRLKERVSVMEQKKQTCYINMNKGVQNMILSIDVNLDVNGTDAVWIFPVPSNPSAIKINILSILPQLNLYYIEDHYLKNISDIFFLIRGSQLIHLPLEFIFGLNMSLSNGEATVNKNRQVILYDKVEKFGLTTELISTPKIEYLKKYLNDKNLLFPEKFNQLINKYINKEYSFVVSYIKDIKSIKSDIGVFVSFPTDKIFFPLLLTSIYDGMKFPIVLYLFGHYAPDLYNEIKNNSVVGHYMTFNYIVPEQLKDFFFGDEIIQFIKLTKISLNSESKKFKDDIWIDDKEPLMLGFVDLIINYKYIMLILIFSIISIISSLLAGITIIGIKKEYLKKFIILGLSNALSIITFSILSMSLFKTFEKSIINYKKIFIISLILSIIFVMLLYNLNTQFETIFRDMGDAKLPSYIHFFLGHQFIYYPIMFLLAFASSFIVIVRGFFYNPKVLDYIVAFMIIFYGLSWFSEHYLYYQINDYYKIIEERSISYK